MKNISYKGKKFSILGDSLSTFEGYSEPRYAEYYDMTQKLKSRVLRVDDTWWGAVISLLEGELLVNNSISGSTVAWQKSYEIASHACSEQRTASLERDGEQPDVIMVYVGTNDWGRGARLYADASGRSASNDPLTFYEAYSVMIERLQHNYPHAEIWCFTLAKSRYSSAQEFEFPYCYAGVHIEKYCDVIRYCAKAHNCRLIDLYAHAEPYDTVDGVHANLEGMHTIASAVIKQVGRFER